MALQPASQTNMYNNRRRNQAQGLPGSTTTAPVRPTEGAIGPGKSYYDFNGNRPGTGYWGNGGGQTTAQPQAQPKPEWIPHSDPGYGEDWWQSHKQQWDQPGAASNYWNGVQGWFTNPTQQEQTIQGYGTQMGNTPGALENLYNQYNANGEFTTPGASEQWWARNGNQYNAPSEGERALSGVLPEYRQSTDMENWNAQHGGEFNQAGDMERFYGQNVDKLYNNNNLAQHQGGIANDINSAQNTGRFFGATAGDLLTPSYTENLADQYQRGPSYNEQFLLGGGATQGLDQLYNRLQGQEARRLDTRAAAGGSFNSGAALRAQEESGADLSAQHVRDYMAASQAADTSRQADDTYGLNLMQGADTGLRGRIDLGLRGAGQADTQALARARAGQDLYTGVSDELRNNLTTAGNWAQNSQADWLGRMTEGANAANESSTQRINRLQGETTAGNDLSTQFLNRLTQGSEAADRTQTAWKNRIDLGVNAADREQMAWQNRLKDAAGLQHDSQADILARLLGGGTLSNQAGGEDIQRYLGGQNSAIAAQNAKQGREAGVLDNLMKVGGAQAGVTERISDAARNGNAQAAMEEINGLLKSGQISAEEAQAKYGAQMQALGLVIQGGKVVAGAMTGGAASAIPSPSYLSRGSGTGGEGDNTYPINF